MSQNNTHSSKCILKSACKLADTAKCNPLCQSYVGMHGYSGGNGRSGNANIPKEYAFVTLVNSPARASQPSVYRTLDQYAETFVRQFEASSDRIKSLYLYGEPGNGKTTTACAVLNAWLVRHYIGSVQRKMRPLDRPGYFFSVNEWQTLYNSFNRPKVPDSIANPAAEKYYNTMNIAKDVPFLVMDDLGDREDMTIAFREDLRLIVSHRVNEALPILYTSNIPIEGLNEVFKELTPKLQDRVRDQCLSLQFTGPSKRGRR